MTDEEKYYKSVNINGVMDYDYYKNLMFDEKIEEIALKAYPEPTADGFAKRSFFKRGVIETLKEIDNLKTMTNKDKNLQSMDNAELSMEFLKKCQKCRETGVPNDMAILAVLHDLADWKDAHLSEEFFSVDKVYKYLVERCFFTEDEAKEVCKGLKEESVAQPD